jgi:ABC-type branched-subunit amino acid transport system permease subunit
MSRRLATGSVGRMPFWLAFATAAAFACLAGVVLSLFAMRLRGHYLAIASLGFAVILFLDMVLSSRRLPSLLGSQRAWFPALAGTMKALRLPTCASAVAYFVHFRRPRDPPAFVFAIAPEAPSRSWRGGGPSRPRVLDAGHP